VSLITPLVLGGNRAVLVVRGWIPIEQATPAKVAQFNEATNTAVIGLIKESQTLSNIAVPTVSPNSPQREWWRVDIGAIQQQMPYQLLPAFIDMLPESGRKAGVLPLRAEEPTPLDEFEHTSYAYQWFTFAIILAFGYIQLIVQQERKVKRLKIEATQPLAEGLVSQGAASHVEAAQGVAQAEQQVNGEFVLPPVPHNV
jgi:surfeit locus 1 family protein